jgi:AraC-like DNA-binding protein
MDVLSDILAHLGLEGSLYFTTEFNAPWGIQVPSYRNVIRFHFVVRGECWVRVGEARQPIRLAPGDFILIPHGAQHALLDMATREARKLDDVLARSGYSGTGCLVYGGTPTDQQTRMICGHLSFNASARHPLLDTLPDHLVVRAAGEMSGSWFDPTLRFLAHKADTGADRIGTSAVIKRLTEIIFIQVMNAWLERERPKQGLLAALADRRLGQSLKAIHRNPSQGWTVASLAREAGMSRTVFAERFKKLAGWAPLHYLTQWRLEKARSLLAESPHSVAAIADSVGYQSLAAFNRAFKKHTNQTPGAYKRQHSATHL